MPSSKSSFEKSERCVDKRNYSRPTPQIPPRPVTPDRGKKANLQSVYVFLVINLKCSKFQKERTINQGSIFEMLSRYSEERAHRKRPGWLHRAIQLGEYLLYEYNFASPL